jgi:hypothetical protein
MNKSILKNIVRGMMNVLVLYPDNDYIRPDKSDFSRDAANLRSDFNHVASDIRKTTLKYGKQIYNRECKKSSWEFNRPTSRNR